MKAFIPGVYIAPIDNEFSKGSDTLEVTLLDEKRNTYLVTKKAGYNRVTEGRKRPKEYALEKWVAVYNEPLNGLQESTTGRLLLFIPDSNALYFGAAEYKKVK